MKPDMYVRIDAITKAGLPGEEVVRVFVQAMTEQAVAEALQMIHGRERGYQRYVEAGGAVRFTSYGEPFIPACSVPSKRPVGSTWRSWNVREDVTEARMHAGRGSLLGPDTRRRARWWELTLSCGHVVIRNVQYMPREDGNPGHERRFAGDARPAPKRIRCDECTRILARTASRAREAAERTAL